MSDSEGKFTDDEMGRLREAAGGISDAWQLLCDEGGVTSKTHECVMWISQMEECIRELDELLGNLLGREVIGRVDEIFSKDPKGRPQ